MGISSNPAGYMASNHTSMIKGNSFSDESVSPPVADASVPPAVSVSSVLMAQANELAPLTIPHLYWHWYVSGQNHKFPMTFDALIDHGADTIFISEQFASSLALKRRKLFKTMSIEMAMPGEGKKQVVNTSEWVKLCLYDPSG
jgi:hypothetical protein